MNDKKQDQKRDSVLRKMLNTPPDPRKAKKDKAKDSPVKDVTE